MMNRNYFSNIPIGRLRLVPETIKRQKLDIINGNDMFAWKININFNLEIFEPANNIKNLN